MVSEFWDMSLPAHDPNFPKPRGLLPVPPDVQEFVAREEARVVREHGFHLTPEAIQRMTDDHTIHYYYEGAYVAYRRTPRGVEVLAVGWDEACKFLEDHPAEARQDVRIGYV